jgi:glycosyltransferase involved in cell wall biosynthesis
MARSVWIGTVHRSKNLRQYRPRPLVLPVHYAQTPLRVKTPPVVSIVTPSFQHGHFLARTIESVLAQQYPRLEYVVQDGGSTDDTLAVLEQYRGRLTHCESVRDRGQADAINRGFRRTTGEIMAWLNSDDLLLPGALASVVDFFEEHPDVDVVYGHRIQIDEQDREIGRWVIPPHDSKVLRWADYVPQETLFWRRSIWEKVGGCVDDTFRFAMDWDLLLRFQNAGARFARLPRFLGAFRVHEQQKTSVSMRTTGAAEIARIRKAEHGREVHGPEIQWHVAGYLLRSAVLDRLIVFGIVRH